MSVKYKAIPMGKPGVVGGGEIKYYASIARESKVDLRSLLDEIAELNVSHSGAVLAVLETFLSRVHYHLVNGRGVELGQLGSFYPSIKSLPAETSLDVGQEHIRQFRVIFRPSQLLKDKLSVVKFEKIKDATVSEEEA